MEKSKSISVKTLIFLLLGVLLVGCSVGGTFAWLKIQTDPVTNTFVAGKVELELKEHVLDPNTGLPVKPEKFTDIGNSDIQMVPGRVIHKDPTVTVKAGSEPCYLRVLMKVNWSKEADNEFAQFAYNDWFKFGDNWTMMRIFDGSYATNQEYVGYDIYEFRYNDIVDARNADVPIPVLTQMKVPDDLGTKKVDALQGCGLTLIAQAIQAEGFADADAAFAEVGYPTGWEPKTPSTP